MTTNNNGKVDAASPEQAASEEARKEGEAVAVQACYLLLAGDLAPARVLALRAIYLLTAAKSLGAP